MSTPIQNPSNGHYYQVVNSQSSWVQNTLTAGSLSDAIASASSNSYRGLDGYLVTITSANENTFVYDLIADQANTQWFIGASDRQTEGTFRWESGPESGSPIFLGGKKNVRRIKKICRFHRSSL